MPDPVITEPVLKEDSPAKTTRQRVARRKSNSESPQLASKTSRLRKSASSSRHKAHPKLKRLLKRGGYWRLLEDRDWRWLYAAYKKGGFKETPEDLTPDEFIFHSLEAFDGIDRIYLAVGKTRKGEIPVGVSRVNENAHLLEVHAEWFPWASDRNIMESTARFLDEHRKQFNIIMPTLKQYQANLAYHGRLGLVRSVGKIERYFPDGETAYVFQTTRT